MRPTEMLRIVGVGISAERKNLIKSLTKFGCIQITSSKDIEGTTKVREDKNLDSANIKLARLVFAAQFVKEHKGIAKRKAKKPTKHMEYRASEGGYVYRVKVVEDKQPFTPYKSPLVSRKPELEFDNFMNSEDSEGDTFRAIVKLEQYNQELLEIKSEEGKSRAIIEQIKPFLNLTLNLNRYHDTLSCAVRVGTIAVKKVPRLDAIKAAYPSLEYEVLTDLTNTKNKVAAIVMVMPREYVASVEDELNRLDFAAFSYSFNGTVKALFEKEVAAIKLAIARRNDVTSRVVKEFDSKDFSSDVRRLIDYYTLKQTMLMAEEDMVETKTSYIFSGWIPDNCVDFVTEKMANNDMALAFHIRSAEGDEVQPTFLEDNAIVSPYQSITNMFSAPMSNEINPNPFVAFFFVLFFGVMISDAGYGLLLVLGSGIVLAIAKPRRNEMSMVKILFMGGLSTIFWGIMFGGYFGIDQAITHIPPIMFNPIDDPMNMLFLSLGLGLLQMMTGMAINAYSLFKQKKPLDAIFGVLSWYVLLIGVGLLFIKPVPMIAGIIVAVLGVVGLMIGGALHKKGAKVIGGAFSKLYGLINFFSDLMSYTRLFGLGLATSVIAMVFNQLAGIIIDINLYIGIIIAPVILIVGHMFNLFINTLGAYVHNSRLQFVEFFGRFYTGGGELFRPLGSTMKYYNFTLEDAVIKTPKKSKKAAAKQLDVGLTADMPCGDTEVA